MASRHHSAGGPPETPPGGGAAPRLAAALTIAAAALLIVPGLWLELGALRAWAGPLPLTGLWLHLAAAALLTPGLILLQPRRRRRPWSWNIAFTALQLLLLPFFAPLLLAVVYGVALRKLPLESPYRRFVFHEPQAVAAPAASSAAAVAATAVEHPSLDAPLLDLLPALEVAERRQAILSLADLEPRRAIPILRAALRDADEEVRLLAYGILSSIEDRLNRRMLREWSAGGGAGEDGGEDGDGSNGADAGAPARHGAGRRAGRRTSGAVPETIADPVRARRLGDLYHEFCHLDLAGQQMQRFYLERAERSYRRSLQLDAEQPRVQLKLARIHLRLQRPQRAEECLVQATLGGVPVIETLPWQAEVYFQQGEMTLLRGVMRTLRQETGLPDTMQRAVNYWTS